MEKFNIEKVRDRRRRRMWHQKSLGLNFRANCNLPSTQRAHPDLHFARRGASTLSAASRLVIAGARVRGCAGHLKFSSVLLKRITIEAVLGGESSPASPEW
jgi:hypothetical protein